MMLVCGIDVSTQAIDIVLIPLDEGAPTWHHHPLTGHDAWERTRNIPDGLPGRHSNYWDDVLAIGIENPAGHHGVHTVQRAVGAVLACMPPKTLVHPWRPSEWRAAVGLKGNATKQDVADYSISALFPDLPPGTGGTITGTDGREWTQDAHDAHCIALATRTAIRT